MRMTKDEILFVAIILLIFVVGAAAKHYRNHHPHVPVVAPSTPGRKTAASPAVSSAKTSAKSRSGDRE